MPKRDAKDYAVEFGGYLATAARRYMASVNREVILEGDTECAEAWSEKRVARLKE